jgi:PAS domain S-box-containing protein
MEENKSPLPKNEQERLNALEKYNVLDTLEESEFNRLVELASIICKTPIALVSLVDEKRQWFKARVGLDVQETPREISFCQHTILGDELFEVEDALQDDRFKDNPLVTNVPDIRFYAGYPLKDPEGYNLGTICVINYDPQQLDEQQKRALKILAEEVVQQLVLRKERVEKEKLSRFFDLTVDLICVATLEGMFVEINSTWTEVLGYELSDLKGVNFLSLIHEEDIDGTLDAMKDLGNGVPFRDFVNRYRTKDGTYKFIQWQAQAKDGLIYALAQDISERLTKEKELQKVSSILQEAERITKMGAWELDLATNKTYWTDEVYAIHEVEKDFDHNKVNGIDFYHPDYRQVISDAITKSIAEQVSFDERCKFISAKGNEKWVRSTGYPILENGKVTKLYGVFIDVTAQVEVEQSLKESKQKFESVLSEMEDTVWSVDMKDFSVLFVSPSVEKLYGYTVDEWLKDSQLWSSVIVDEDKYMIDDMFKAIETTGRAEKTYRVKTKEGKLKWVLNKVKVVKDSAENLRLDGIVRDITAQVKAEELLKESELRFSVAVEGTEAGIWDWDMVKNTVHFSLQWKSMLGYTDAEVENSFDGWKNLWHPEDESSIIQLVNDHLAGVTEKYEVVHRCKHKDGSWRWLMTRGKIIKDETGVPIRWVGTNIDVTPLKTLEIELKAINESLYASEEELKASEEELRSSLEEQYTLRDNLERSHEALNTKQAQIDSILNSIDDFIYSVRLSDNQVLFVTPNCYTVYGVTYEEWMADNQAWMERIYGEDKHLIPKMFNALETKGRFDYEYRIVMPDESIKWVHNVGYAVVENEQPVRLDGVIRDVTLTKNIRLKEQYSSNLIEQFYALSPIGMALNDFETGKFIQVNQSLLNSVGYTHDEFVQLSYFDLTPKEFHASEMKILEDLKSRGKYGPFEKQYIHKDGYLVNVVLNGVLVEDEFGEKKIWSVVEDVTEKKEKENTIKTTLNSLTESQRISKLGSWRFDVTSGNVQWSEANYELFEIDSTIQGQELFNSYKNCLSAEDFVTVMKLVENTIQTKEPYKVEHAIVTPNGTKKQISGLGKLVIENNKPFVLGTAQDITESYRIHLLNELINELNTIAILKKDSKEFYDKILIDLLDVMESEYGFLGEVLFDADDKPYLKTYALTNIAWDDATRAFYDQHAPNGLEFRNLETLFGYAMKHKEVVISNDPVNDTRRGGLPKGHPPLNAFLGIPILLGDDLIGMIGLANKNGGYSKSDEKFLEPLIANLGTAFYAKKIEQQRQIMEEALFESKEIAEKANQSKSMFLSNMSHEIRTPLSGVVGFSNLLSKTDLDQLQQLYVTNLQQSSKHLLSIVNDILDFSKIEAGKMEIDPQENDLQEFISELADMLAFNANQNNTELIVNVPPEIARHLVFDRVRLGQVILNLLSNAIKFTHEGTVELVIREKDKKDKHVQLIVEVKDDGVGISEDKLKVIFESFSQEDISTTRKFGGTGLGLTIANNLLNLMGGSTLQVSSKLGEGSTFWFELNLEIVKENAANEQDSIQYLAMVDNSSKAVAIQQALVFYNVKVDFYANANDFLQAINNGKNYEAVALNIDQLTELDLPKLLVERKKRMNDVKFILHTSRFESFDLMQEWQEEFKDKVCRYPMTVFKLEDCLFKSKDYNKVEAQSFENTIVILIVDDNAINILLAQKIIQQAFPNVTIHTAKSGAEAIDFYTTNEVDLVLMDVHMPDMNGYEATLAMRELKPNSKTRFIALTASDSNEERENCERYKMNGFLSKPIGENQLKAYIDEHYE